MIRAVARWFRDNVYRCEQGHAECKFGVDCIELPIAGCVCGAGVCTTHSYSEAWKRHAEDCVGVGFAELAR